MMIKIKKILENFNKIPVAVIFLIAIASCIFYAIPNLLVVAQSKSSINTYLNSLGFAFSESTFATFAWGSFFISAIITWALMELVLEILFRLQNNKHCFITEKKIKIKNSFRLALILINVVAGFFGLGIFLANTIARDVLLEIQSTVRIVLEVVLYTTVIFALHGEEIREDKVYTSYSMLFNLFVIVQCIRHTIILITSIFDFSKGGSVISWVFDIINICLVIAAAIALYFLAFKRTRKMQIEFIARNSMYNPNNSSQPPDGGNDIFGGDYNI